MIMNSRDVKDVQTKQEGDTTDCKVPKASSTSRQWGGFKNPRIVRVSRAFGGKDRHSKVCTVRGLRDRRIRLSVPTAIQLYDLQDRLGVGQPSKVVDWLLDATKQDIDKLPPLQMPPGNFSQFHQQALFPQESVPPQASLSQLFNANSVKIKDGGAQSIVSNKGGININDHVDGNDQPSLDRSKYLASDREIASDQKGKWRASNEQENLNNLAQNFFPLANQSSSFPGLLNNALPYNPYFHWEPSNLSLSPFGNHYFSSQTDDSHINHSLQLPSSAPFHSGSQLYFCPSMPTMPSIPPYLPPYMNAASVENEMKQINHLQLMSSSSQHVLPNSMMPSLHLMKSFPLNGNSKANPSQEDNHNGRNISK